jgi:UDP-N-acetylbacillosamine N-acetyltransferase
MTRKAIIIGAGGHCRVILSLLAACGIHEVLGIVDRENTYTEEVIMGVRVIGSINFLQTLTNISDLDVFLAIGDNILRRTLWHRVRALGLALPNLISPQALIDPNASLGSANVICARAFIGPEAVLGNNNLVNTAAVLEHNVKIGSHCHFAPSSTVAGRTIIGDGCFLGAGATIIDKIKLSTEITIGAGSTVIRDISSRGVYVGIPARKIG